LLNTHRQQNHHHRKCVFFFSTPFYEASGDGYDLVYPDVFDGVNQQRIGKIVFPDVVELEGSGAEDIYNKYGISSLNSEDKQANKKKTPSSVAPQITHLLFGYPLTPAEPSEDTLRYTSRPKRLWLRCDDPCSGPQFMYLEAPPTSCYCDDSCTTLGDCCSDYTVVCPPQECVVSNWGEWEGCVADDGICGLGVEQRVRHVTQQAARGGTPCPPLKEMRTCFKLCSKRRSLDGKCGELINLTICSIRRVDYLTLQCAVINELRISALPKKGLL
uniref:SMB domain-containing protein n=1 Tax=Angiostrongylus cantonensis TaxID=6313 RepID=A0A0K0DM14_ANGCA